MGKIALISVLNKNYGSMLQAYALQKVLFNMGMENSIIFYQGNYLEKLRRFKNLNFLRKKCKVSFQKLKCNMIYRNEAYRLKLRDTAFEQFKRENMCFTNPIYQRKELLKEISKYNKVVLGSDQVWHPDNLEMDYFTLNFVPNYIKKIAYAPSFGVSDISLRQKNKTISYLNRLNSLSIRERTGEELIFRLTGRKAQVVCDPTILLRAQQWGELTGAEPLIKQPYIFCYFIGNNSSHRVAAKKLADGKGLKIVTLPHIDQFNKNDQYFGDIQLYDIGPKEFLNLICHAAIVLTDSFHATVFSLVFSRTFLTLNRFENDCKNSTDSRITTLLDNIGIQSHYIRIIDSKRIWKIINSDIDWVKVKKRLELYRQDSFSYLEESLNSE